MIKTFLLHDYHKFLHLILPVMVPFLQGVHKANMVSKKIAYIVFSPRIAKNREIFFKFS